MGFMHFRIDDRLVHGIVAGYWVNYLKATRIMVIDDHAAENLIVKNSLRMACPKNINLSVLGVEKAIANIKNGNYENQRLLVIAKCPTTFYKLFESGITISQINMGNITYTEDKMKVTKTVAINEEQYNALLTMSQHGTRIESQLTPEDNVADFMKLIKK